MVTKAGTVFNYLQLPDVSQFPFVISKRVDNVFIRKGLFVFTKSNEGFLIGIIERIILLNEYFTDALTIKAYNTNTNPNILKGLFPSEDFEFAIAIVKSLGIIKFKGKSSNKIEKILRMTYPASPGRDVYIVEEDILNEFIGFEQKNGLEVGRVKVTHTMAKINMSRLLNKHFAILSISGGGKSYLTSILIEELLKRDAEYGTPAIILFDVHGEYSYLKEIPELKDKVSVQDISYFQISVPKMPLYTFKKYQEDISNVQIRELAKFIKKLKKDESKKKGYTIGDIIEALENELEGNKNSRQALIGWLSNLERLTIFGSQENPILDNIIEKQKLIIFNLQKEVSIRKKQIMVDYICTRLFNLRRLNKIPPFLLIIEEAHQFCPEAAHSKAISKPIIETIAREGRKFMSCLCLISQRPKRLSTTALSQCNSKMVLNIKNPYDIKHLMDSSESITKEYGNMISSLGVGEMLLMGSAINYPVFIDIRERLYKSVSEESTLAQVCLKWESKQLK
ncbi:MAG: ATP-binding protein [Candidatus Lokiarchaeota archaeon]|nr:ATP-binding protein [Candidatus Lokiarchaeota archaeon]